MPTGNQETPPLRGDAVGRPQSIREYLVTNGLGGFASGPVAGGVARRYHGLLIAALPAPLGRMVMLTALEEELIFPDGSVVRLDVIDHAERRDPPLGILREFRLELGLPVWRYEIEGVVVERRVLMAHRQNTVYVLYRLPSGGPPLTLNLRPLLNFRQLESSLEGPAGPYAVTHFRDRREITAVGTSLPPLRLLASGDRTSFSIDERTYTDVSYRMEAERGYESIGSLWSPGILRIDLTDRNEAALVASTEDWDWVEALRPSEVFEEETERRHRLLDAAHPATKTGAGADLVLAADQFVFLPAGRPRHAARTHAAGDEFRSVVAGYHWFTDWGRDTMIALEGLTLTTGRGAEAGYILRTFAHYVRDGLIPNFFPDGQNEGLYHTADATLWFFQAVSRYLAATNDRLTLRAVLPQLHAIIGHHLAGTRFGIGVDPRDGLLRQGAEGLQLTWMDAKVGDWVVTPRRGKAVEINALWYNALRLLATWVTEEDGEAAARALTAHAERARSSFNSRFWWEPGGHLYDVVDGDGDDDPSLRPNQLLAISLSFPVLDERRWSSVLEAVGSRLLTPVGLRSLAPEHPDYRPKYFGDLRSRDAAYHQGTVWAWLIGPYIDAWLKTYPEDRAGARTFLNGLVASLGEYGVGSIGEIFDAEEPYAARGCIAQAWSVAEVLRAWVRTAPALGGSTAAV